MVLSPQMLPASGGLLSGLSKLLQQIAPVSQQGAMLDYQKRQQDEMRAYQEQQQAQEIQRQQRTGNILSQVLQEAGPDADPNTIYATALKMGADPKILQPALSAQLQQQKQIFSQQQSAQKEAAEREKLKATYDILRPQLAERGINLPEEPPGNISVSALTSLLTSTSPQFEKESEKLEAQRVNKLAEDIVKGYQVAQNEDFRLDRQLKLVEKGNLSTPMMVKALDYIGLPLAVLNNPDTEEYSKLENEFVKEVSDIFTGQIRVYEIETYLKTIPGLLNSDEGKKVIIKNKKIMNDAKRIKYNAYKDIIRENNGKKPANLDILINDRTADQISQLGDKFNQNLEDSEKFQPKFKMYDSEGNEYDIPSSKIPDATKSGLFFR